MKIDEPPSFHELAQCGTVIIAHELEPGWVLLRFNIDSAEWDIIANFFISEKESINYLDFLYSIKAINAPLEELSKISQTYDHENDTNRNLH